MKYKEVSIVRERDRLVAKFRDIPGDIEEVNTEPLPFLRSYLFKATMKKEVALDILKRAIMIDMTKEIREVTLPRKRKK